MSSIQLSFPDGSVREYPKGGNSKQVAESISSTLKKNAVA